LYTSGYRHKDIPDYLWETQAEVKSCVPRMVRLALTNSPSVYYAYAQRLITAWICLRVLLNCLMAFMVDLLWSLLPQVIQRARGGHSVIGSSSRTTLIDTVITFDSVIPHVLLAPFAGQIIHFPMNSDPDDFGLYSSSFFRRFVPNIDLFVTSTDWEAMRWSSERQVTTIYSPVVSVSSPLSPSHHTRWSTIFSNLDLHPKSYFVMLAWYSKLSDLCLGIEAFGAFLSSHMPPPGELPSEEEEGSTGSTAKFFKLPKLVIADVLKEDYVMVMKEVHRLKLVEGAEVILLLRNTINPAGIGNLIENSVALLHTPSDINDIRIPCAGMLAAVPVISTMSFCSSEPVRHESTGILVKAGSPQMLAQSIDMIYNMHSTRPVEWRRMGQRGKQRAVTEFSIEMFGSRLDDVLESLGHPSSAPTRGRSLSGASAHAKSVGTGLSDLANFELQIY
jgi:glycosyltransferase involved in cell wall biosynthesis